MEAGTEEISKAPKAAFRVRESEVVNACIKWLYANGVYCWRNNTGAYRPEKSNRYIRYGHPGSPDIFGITPRGGRIIGIECKSSTGALRDNQIAFGGRVSAAGGIYIVARSIDDLEAHRAEILGVM